MDSDSGQVIANPTRVRRVLLLAALLVVYVVIFFVLSRDTSWFSLAYLAAVIGVVGWQSSRSAIVMDSVGIVCRGQWRTPEVAWRQIDSFDVKGNFLGHSILAHLKDGSTVRIMRYYYIINSPAKDTADMLERERKRRTGKQEDRSPAIENRSDG